MWTQCTARLANEIPFKNRPQFKLEWEMEIGWHYCIFTARESVQVLFALLDNHTSAAISAVYFYSTQQGVPPIQRQNQTTHTDTPSMIQPDQCSNPKGELISHFAHFQCSLDAHDPVLHCQCCLVPKTGHCQQYSLLAVVPAPSSADSLAAAVTSEHTSVE